jgi:thiol-disulfide isomerase/thioredoxin
MSRFIRTLAMPVSVIAIAATAIAQGPVTLKIGDTAPPLQIKLWVKGTPVKTLGHGAVNVVEFWATWCGPCRESIPHLTELAHKYKGKATFTGVSVFEVPNPTDESYLPKVGSFVKEMGGKMDYNVAADGQSGIMGKSWMEAAGQDGIPTAFVVDQKGKVVWIGHPMDGLDEAVGQVIKGTFDIKAEAAKLARAQADAQAVTAKQQADAENQQKEMKPLLDAFEAKKYDVVIAEAEKMIVKHPEAADQISFGTFQILMGASPSTGYAYARTLAKGRLKDNGTTLNEMAWSMVDDENKMLKVHDYATAIVIAKAAAEAGKMKEPFSLDTYAYALFKSGDTKGALDIQTQAVNVAIKMGNKVDAKTLKEMKDRLAKFKANIKA